MPSRYSSEGTRPTRAASPSASASRFFELPIETIVEAFAGARTRLSPARSRGRRGEHTGANPGTLLMALSNKFGWLVVATGNKSEFGRLRDALRRYGGRLRPPQGRLQDGRVPPGAVHERAGRTGARPEVGDRARPERGATARPARRRLAASLREAGPRARSVRRARPVARGARPGRVRARDRRARALPRGPRGVQAPPGASRGQAPPEGVRPRPAVPITNRWSG